MMERFTKWAALDELPVTRFEMFGVAMICTYFGANRFGALAFFGLLFVLVILSAVIKAVLDVEE